MPKYLPGGIGAGCPGASPPLPQRGALRYFSPFQPTYGEEKSRERMEFPPFPFWVLSGQLPERYGPRRVLVGAPSLGRLKSRQIGIPKSVLYGAMAVYFSIIRTILPEILEIFRHFYVYQMPPK
jgi:hypothetical protein